MVRSFNTERTYTHVLAGLHAQLSPASDHPYEFLADISGVIAAIETRNISPNSKKIYYTAIVSYLKGVESLSEPLKHYRQRMNYYSNLHALELAKHRYFPYLQ